MFQVSRFLEPVPCSILTSPQRLKGAIDQTIAQEQARQRQFQSSPSRSDSRSQRSNSRNLSPGARRANRRGTRGQGDGSSPAPSGKGPDPSAFEADFVIGDDELSRSGTPRPATEEEGTKEKSKNDMNLDGKSDSQDGSPYTESPNTELPTDVRVKLRKLDKLESRYNELLRSYRIAHARVQSIEPFETSLRENTPLTSISDPNALVEYLNQVNLKGGMVLDELKRVSSERDEYQKKLVEAEKSSREAWEEVANLKKGKDSKSIDEATTETHVEDEKQDQALVDGDPLGATKTSPPSSIKSPVRGLSIFSPKLKSPDTPKLRQSSEDLFSYDDEIPRLESEVKAKHEKIVSLTNEVESLKTDLAVTRESTQSMVQTLEESAREASALRDSKDRSDTEYRQQQDMLERALEKLRGELRASEESLERVQAGRPSQDDRVENLEKQLEATSAELSGLQEASRAASDEQDKIRELQGLVTSLQAKVIEADERNNTLDFELAKALQHLQELQSKLKEVELRPLEKVGGGATQPDTKTSTHKESGTTLLSNPDANPSTKKKSKKKKKSFKQASEEKETIIEAKEDDQPSGSTLSEGSDSNIIERLREELKQLQILISEKDAAIERMNLRLKDQDGLQEEIETLRDDLLHVGQEHVEAKDKTKELQAEKSALEQRVAAQEEDISRLQASSSSGNESEQKHKALSEHFEALKSKAGTLQTDLSAAQQLASSRFKDLNELRSVLQKAQPEIDKLRSEAAELKNVKEALGKKVAEFKRLDSRHEDMRLEVNSLKQTVSKKDQEITSLNKKMNQETSSRLKADEASSKATQEMQNLETERRQAVESLDRLSRELTSSKEDLANNKTKLRDMEQQMSKQRSESAGLKEDMELKAAQYASAQSLMTSMRDQTAEMAIQMKEARERCESLEEEVTDAHRLLGERSREGETMRRLLADVEGRADARVREMKERMETAVEERDRAEDEASIAGRRKTRELEDFRTKYRDLERSLKRVEDDKEELESAQKDWKRRREELESRAEAAQHEVEEVRKAMSELRDTLDESEKQARELEKQRSELRRSVEETQVRLEKLQKSNKVRCSLDSPSIANEDQSMAEEISKVTARTKAPESEVQSSRSSIDSAARLASPAPPARKSSASPFDGTRRQNSNGQPSGQMDYVYLKNVLLQFLEQKDKKHQQQLIPVLGMLLHFDRKDEQRWMSAIN